MKLTNREIQHLNAALAIFDGRMVPILDKERSVVGHETVMLKVAWRVTYAVARTKKHLANALDAINDARNAIIGKHSNGAGKVEEKDPGHAACMKELDAVDRESQEVELHRVKIADLDLTTNTSIGGTALAALMPWLIDEE